jgi:hypothetical protein
VTDRLFDERKRITRGSMYVIYIYVTMRIMIDLGRHYSALQRLEFVDHCLITAAFCELFPSLAADHNIVHRTLSL